MNIWTTILDTALPEIIDLFKKTTAPAATPAQPTSSTPTPAPVSGTVTLNKEPSDTVKLIQHILNVWLQPSTPLAEDGWWGNKTDAAMKDALVKARPYLAMIGINV